MISKSLNLIIPLVVYPFDVMVSFNQTDEVIIKQLKRKGVDNPDVCLKRSSEQQRGRCIMFPTGQTLIRLYEYPKTPEHYGFLQHEIFHAVDFILDRIGMKLCNKSCEAYCYLIQHLTTEIYTKLK